MIPAVMCTIWFTQNNILRAYDFASSNFPVSYVGNIFSHQIAITAIFGKFSSPNTLMQRELYCVNAWLVGMAIALRKPSS